MEISNEIKGIGELSFVDEEENVRAMMFKIDKLFSEHHMVFEGETRMIHNCPSCGKTWNCGKDCRFGKSKLQCAKCGGA